MNPLRPKKIYLGRNVSVEGLFSITGSAMDSLLKLPAETSIWGALKSITRNPM